MNNQTSPDNQPFPRKSMHFEDPVAKVKEWHIGLWRKLVGPSVVNMVQDRKEAERQLAHPDWKMRCAALSVLEIHLNAEIDRHIAQTFEKVGLHDPNPQVRGVALRALGVCYENSHDARVGKLLAQVVLDESESLQPRGGAYIGLFYLRGLHADLSPRPLCIPADLDWRFVESFLDFSG